MSVVLDIYIKQGCHLCEDLVLQLKEIAEHRPFQLNSIDITHDQELLATHGDNIPVLMHGTHEICHYFLDLQALKQVLDNKI
ncbi:hypothetical protein MNBD_GAMMA12-3442 [hydrothermal vent metagenome]|uniref:Thioredoxin family protein n=1 Tax=hydrothermal vent metagenome TaxID=652676 RepID=A0A3B0YWU8_9ZZZZ